MKRWYRPASRPVLVDLEDRNQIALMDATRMHVVGNYGLSDKGNHVVIVELFLHSWGKW